MLWWILTIILRTADASGGSVLDIHQSNFDPAWDTSWLYRGLPPVGQYTILQYPAEVGGPWEPWTWEWHAPPAETIHLVCLDQDLPPGSKFTLEDPESRVGGIIWLGQLARRVHLIDTGYIKVSYTPPGRVDYRYYAGFRCMIWLTHMSNDIFNWSPRPRTTCSGATGDVLVGGEILSHQFPPDWNGQDEDYFLDCVWQLKLPPRSRGTQWQVYLRVTKLDLDGMLEIREGISSQGSLIASNGSPADRNENLKSLRQPREGFVSNQGIYIRLVKRYNNSELRFVYGAFVFINGSYMAASDRDSNRCSGAGLKVGFRCSTPVSGGYWCIPLSNVCNKLPNCPDGSDETPASCAIRSLYPSDPHNKSNAVFELAHLHCNTSAGEKYCPLAEKCIPIVQRCPVCRDDAVLRCDGGSTCFLPDEICDGFLHCKDGTDELTCGTGASLRSPLLISMWTILTLVIVALFVGTVYVLCERPRQFSPVHTDDIQDTVATDIINTEV